jgi:hypothetical protein
MPREAAGSVSMVVVASGEPGTPVMSWALTVEPKALPTITKLRPITRLFMTSSS